MRNHTNIKASPSKPPVTSVHSPTGRQVFAGGCWMLLGEIGVCWIRNLLEIDLVATDCRGHPQFDWMTAFLLTLTIYSLSCSEVWKSAEQTGNRECSLQSKSPVLQLQPTHLEKVQLWLCFRFASHVSQVHYSSESTLQVFADKLATSMQTTGDQPDCSQPKQCQASFQYRYLLLAIFMQLLIQLQNARFSLTIGGFQSITNRTPGTEALDSPLGRCLLVLILNHCIKVLLWSLWVVCLLCTLDPLHQNIQPSNSNLISGKRKKRPKDQGLFFSVAIKNPHQQS